MSDLLLMLLAIIIAFILVSIVVRLLKGAFKIVLIILIALLVFGFMAGVNFTDIGDKNKENKTYVEYSQEEDSVTGKITGMATKVTNPDWWEAKIKRKVGEQLIESADSKTVTKE